jgi:hypothetical protein
MKNINKQTLERLSYIANVCRSQNTDPELSSMLGELDSTLQEHLDGEYGQTEPEKTEAELYLENLHDNY